MTLAQIAALTLEDTYIVVLDRILDITVVPDGEEWVTLHENETLDFYDRILLHANLVKPTLTVLNTELTAYKAELTAIENARLAEIARVDDINTRFSALDPQDVRGAFEKLGLDIPNPEVELKRIIQSDDQTRLTDLETKAAERNAERISEGQKAIRVRTGGGAVQACFEVINVIAGHNIENALTPAQKDQQAVDHSAVFDALKSFRPGKAKSLITAITPDGTLVTTAMKDEIMEVFTKYGI